MGFVDYEKNGHIVTITMNLPERLNAMDVQAWYDMADAWVDFDNDDDAWIAILTGRGRAFSAGADLKAGPDPKGPRAGHPEYDPFFENRLNKPTIAAVNGLAFGGGWFLSFKADYRVAAEGALFQVSEIHRNLLSDYGIQFLQSIGSGLATELSLGGTVSAERLYNAGFLNRVVPADQVMDAALEIANQVLALPPLAVQYTLKLMHMVRNRNIMRLSGGIPSENFPEGQPVVQEALSKLRGSEDSAESRRAFLEKRTPVYLGR